MNSFDVPYDENLFESNDFMKSYWARSTENRNVSFVQDLRSNEVMNDDSELRGISMVQHKDVDEDELDDEKLDDSVRLVETSFNEKPKKHVLEAKALSTGATAIWVLIAVGAILLFLMNYKIYKIRE